MHWDLLNAREYKGGDDAELVVSFLRLILIAARAVLKLQRTLSFRLKVFISGPSELLWTLEWHNDMDWDSSQHFAARCKHFHAYILFNLCNLLLIKRSWLWLNCLGDSFLSSPWQTSLGRPPNEHAAKVKSFQGVSLHPLLSLCFTL